MWQSLEMFATIGAAKQLPEVGAQKNQLRVTGVHRHTPHGAVDFPGQLDLLPILAMVVAAQKFSIVTRWPIAIGEKHNGRVVQAWHHGAGVLPGRFQFLKHPVLTLVGAAVQATVGGGIDPAVAAVRGWDHRDPMHICRHQALIQQLPGLTMVSAAVDAANFHRGPHHTGRDRVEQNLCDAGRAHVDV